ncbi:DUF4229 domain-containing protein [Streptomyces sp. NPDC091292]|uniref:DUF4229 domain-containing protein n=1 Tax=Streptomyces sp. NPDC091292 TaxID=3365991 RepID=UPI00380E18C5
MLRYTLMRLGVFAGSFVVVWGLVYAGVLPRGLGGSNLLWVLLLAMVISAPLSFVLLRGQRDRASEQVVGRIDRAKASMEANRTQEDLADDAARATAAQNRTTGSGTSASTGRTAQAG